MNTEIKNEGFDKAALDFAIKVIDRQSKVKSTTISLGFK
jgi:hypothetical protein